ncbi:MAG: pilus assembly protein [Roseibium album]|uniref:Flp pilus assembly protein TadG n=1 Tax=Roseibium album TaxID=311410 RepID=A0A0M7AX56_9HYPH|nr:MULTISPECIES: TadE/TadG family type IV pilus assembly protein [Stappiaceae]MBG6145858.1 Flp pilus assembly protein TadG [Labrenzia sp. EL_142]MBG6154705.1 Flp pilus assembly protein TadG [Labrenzia sp. EL_162]MBG6161984.1 Flp pilus assembly protein TadG [Labrenzia sp. EL_195]MBG6193165.1 Flp pilus assembly protein TadG [Labrenzia sp. EL_159]MBG6199529.1 Flp pilus assembly protein TadG [Labrenzia sp. EL_13]MBG6211307.1 Flp pilus assembly protein TadG [Labrenzia sp. EL_126]MCR9061338.1 pilu
MPTLVTATNFATGAMKKFRRDDNAVSAVEFAMILPFMFFLLIGMTELAEALNQDRKVSRIANAVADLIAQEEAVSRTDLDSLMNIGEKILDPYPSTNLQVIVASVSFDDDGDASVDWSRDSAGATPWSTGAAPPITLPGTVAVPNSSIVVGQSNLTYTPSFTGLFSGIFEWSPSVMNLSDTYFLTPRITGTVTCSNC